MHLHQVSLGLRVVLKVVVLYTLHDPLTHLHQTLQLRGWVLVAGDATQLVYGFTIGGVALEERRSSVRSREGGRGGGEGGGEGGE